MNVDNILECGNNCTHLTRILLTEIQLNIQMRKFKPNKQQTNHNFYYLFA